QGGEARWRAENELPALHEAQRLQLDCTKAADKLGWTPRLSLDQALDLTTDWYLRAAQETAGDALLALTRAQPTANPQ
ncbi:MAG TPA: CDP-glucose 4,6-dehydratase, partial [Alphaproteobacteria bacterium]|nr:CDP-glucose 4,6-dehydratase [Alphaproteobacteria bacterium]